MSHCPQPISDEGTKKGKFNEDNLRLRLDRFRILVVFYVVGTLNFSEVLR